jgi:membrane protein
VIRQAGRIAKSALERFLRHSGPDRAAAVAYYTMLSLVPLLLFLVSVGVWLFGSFDAAYRWILLLFRGVVVPLDAASLESLRTFVASANQVQGAGLLLLAWTSRRAFSSLLSALEKVFEAPPRSFARGNLMSFGLVLASGLALLATLAVTMLIAVLQGAIEQLAGPPVGRLFRGAFALFMGQVLPTGISLSFFYVVYRFFPRRELSVTPVHAAVGATLAALLWEAAKSAFAVYIRRLTHYAGLYGALEGIVILALWLELSASIILYCGEIVALLTAARASHERIRLASSGA